MPIQIQTGKQNIISCHTYSNSKSLPYSAKLWGEKERKRDQNIRIPGLVSDETEYITLVAIC